METVITLGESIDELGGVEKGIIFFTLLLTFCTALDFFIH